MQTYPVAIYSKGNPDCDTNYDPPPISDFSYKHNSGYLNQVNFTNKSTNATHFLWDFGDGQTSTQSNPGTIYYTSGTYTETYNVSLKAFNADGNHHTSTKTVVIPGQQGTGGINLDGYHISHGNDQYWFQGIASGAFRYNFTFFMGDGEQRRYTDSMGWESFYYTYSKPSAGTYYTPTILVQGFDENGYMVGEHYIQLFQIFVDKVDIGQLSINITTLNASNQSSAPVVDKPFKLKANCTNFSESLTWQWVVFNITTPNDNSMQCNKQTGCKVFWGSGSNSFTTPQLTIRQPGKYLTQLTVWGGDYSSVINYDFEVSSGSDCVWPRFLITDTYNQQIYRKGSTICLEDISTIIGYDHCKFGSNYYSAIAKLEWKITGTSGSSYLRKCEVNAFFYEDLNVNCSNPPYAAKNRGFKNFTLNNVGKYTVTLKAWAGITNFYGKLDILDNVHNQTTREIFVIDCDEFLELNSSIEILSKLNNNLITSGNITIRPMGGFWGSSIIVQNPEPHKKMIIQAYNSIVLKPGVTVKGSDVRLRIAPCPPLTNPCVLSKSLDPNELIYIDNKLLVYPNPNSGNFVVELNSENDMISKVEVVSIAGGLIDQRLNVNNFYSELDLSNEADGVYIVRVFTKNGEVYSTRVIKQR